MTGHSGPCSTPPDGCRDRPRTASAGPASPGGASSANGSATACSWLAMVLFIVGLVVGFTDGSWRSSCACLVVGSLVLAPAIVFSYAVRAAERDDEE